MGLNTWIRDRIRAKLFAIGGVMSTPTDDDDTPVAIANELHGGAHGYRTLEELAAISKDRLSRPMQAIVLRHSRPDDTVYPTTTLILDPTDEIWDPFLANPNYRRISDIPGYDLSLFWKNPKENESANNPQDIQSQYADSQDYGRVGDPSTPAFQEPLISGENYQLGRRSNVDSTIIWSDEYDPAVHKYERQRIGDLGKWGIPKLINQTSYSQGDFVDNRFIWVDKNEVPSRPPSLINGQYNNEPAGWQNTPAVPGGADYYDYIVDHDLFRISAQKSSNGDLKGEWGTPFKISTDPNLVRYGNNPSSTNFIGPGGADTADWRGYFTPGTDTHMATRYDSLSPWRIQNIDNESGEYVDYIFKAFPLGYEPTSLDRPTIANPFSELEADYPNNLWKDYPFTVASNQVLFRSVGRKYNNGQLKPSGWSIPTKANGDDVIQVVIEPQGATSFKYTAAGVVSPASIILKAKLYRGKEEVAPDVPFKWYKGDVSGPNEIIKDSVVPPSNNHVISGTNNDTLTISPAAVNDVQLYSLVGLLSGEDYQDNVSILDVTDGIGIAAAIESNDGFVYKNATGSKVFVSRLYANGALVDPSEYTCAWFLGLGNITDPLDNDQVTIDGSDFEDKEVLRVDITYDGNVFSRTETLVDLEDAEDVVIQYSNQNPLPPIIGDQVWTSDPINAYYMRISNDGGTTFGAATRIRGENAPYNGGFQKSAFKNASSPPSATGLTSDLLPTGTGWTHAPTTPAEGEFIFEVTSFFIKNSATSDVSLTSANWNQVDSWSTAIQKNGADGSAEGPQGDPGPVGWSPVLGVITRSATSEVLKVIDWINLDGADIGTKPDSNVYYISETGFTTDINAAKNVKGNTGPNGSGAPTGGTKYSRVPFAVGSSSHVNGTDLSASGFSGFGRIYGAVNFTMPSEAYYNLNGRFYLSITGDGGGIEKVRMFVQRIPTIGGAWTTITGNYEFITDSGSNTFVCIDFIDDTADAGSAYSYRLVCQTILGGNSQYSTNIGHSFTLVPG